MTPIQGFFWRLSGFVFLIDSGRSPWHLPRMSSQWRAGRHKGGSGLNPGPQTNRFFNLGGVGLVGCVLKLHIFGGSHSTWESHTVVTARAWWHLWGWGFLPSPLLISHQEGFGKRKEGNGKKQLDSYCMCSLFLMIFPSFFSGHGGRKSHLSNSQP